MSDSGNLTIVVQAGGESRRMGRSKATVPFMGEPLLWRSVRRLLPLADEFIITTNEPQALGFLGGLVESGTIRLVSDIDPNARGALRGVHTAFEAATNDYIALVACDMIFPSRNLIAEELHVLIRDQADVVVPKTRYGYEPFHAVYRKKTCLPVVTSALAKGEIRATSWFDEVAVEPFDDNAIAAAEPRGGCFINVNTPQELAEIEEKITSGEMLEREKFD